MTEDRERRQGVVRRISVRPVIPPPTVRNEPSIALAGLAEYVLSTQARQRRILREQKAADRIKAPWYRETRAALRKCLGSADRDREPIHAALKQLRDMPLDPKRQARQKTGIEALTGFLAWLPLLTQKLDLSGVRPAGKLKHMQISGVTVRVSLDLLIEAPDGMLVGAVKLYVGKKALSAERAHLMSTTLYQYMVETLSADRVLANRCAVVDVMAKKIWRTPKSRLRRRQEVEAACANIAAIWPSL